MRTISDRSVVVLVPDGVGVRNFILGRFLNQLAAAFRPHVFHYIPDQLLPHYADRADDSVEWYPMSPYLQHPTALVLQYTLGYGHMYWAHTNAMQRALNRPVKGSFKSKLLVRSTRLMGRVGAALNCMNAIESLHCRAVAPRPEVDHYRSLFKRIQPEVLFCSHQRPTTVLPAVLAARELGIPTATFIFSWDNLSSKGRIAAPFDHYLVWSNHMREELMQFYPHVPHENIHIVGTPQFDPYVDQSLLWSREEFCRRAGADPSRKLICYSGGDAGTCPEDPQHVELLMSQVRSGLIRGNPEVLLRPVPVDDGRRYDGVCSRYPELKRLQPQWVHTDPPNWAKVVPLADDVQFLATLTHHADMNINRGSTMTLDSARMTSRSSTSPSICRTRRCSACRCTTTTTITSTSSRSSPSRQPGSRALRSNWPSTSTHISTIRRLIARAAAVSSNCRSMFLLANPAAES